MGSTKKPEPHPIDTFAGKRVREIRLLKGMTQMQLAERIGVAFQQLQKYESADNRISASRLYLICKALGTTIPRFFSEFYSEQRKRGRTVKMLESADTMKLAELFFKMSSKKRQLFYEIGELFVKGTHEEGWARIIDKPKADPKAHPFDIYVGKRIWQFRMIANMGRRQLSGKIGLQYQQIVNYETAKNRVSVTKLYLICEVFGVSIPEFFADFHRKQKKQGIMEIVKSREGMKLAGLFFRMSPSNRKHFIRLGKKLMEED